MRKSDQIEAAILSVLRWGVRYSILFLGLQTLTAFVPAGYAQSPADWHALTESKTGCTVSVPQSWKIDEQMRTLAHAPNNGGSVTVSGRPGKPLVPLSEMAQKALSVDKMVENTSKLVLYAVKPTKSDNPITPYIARAAHGDGVCSALIDVRASVPEDTVKKIAMSLK